MISVSKERWGRHAGAEDHTGEHHAFSHGACPGHPASCLALETQVASGLVSDMSKGHLIGGPVGWRSLRESYPCLAQGTNSMVQGGSYFYLCIYFWLC